MPSQFSKMKVSVSVSSYFIKFSVCYFPKILNKKRGIHDDTAHLTNIMLLQGLA